MNYSSIFLLTLQSMECLGFPVSNSELASMADNALGLALAEVNSVYAASRLFRVTRGSVTKVVPMGVNNYSLTINFGVKETVCPKSSTEDPQRCAFMPGFFVPSASCSSHVRVSPDLSRVLSLRCGQDSSSSSEESSSEEKFQRKRQHNTHTFRNRGQTPSAPPSVLPDRPIHREDQEAQLRGDTFDNYLV